MVIIDNSLAKCLLQLPAFNLSNTALIECKLYWLQQVRYCQAQPQFQGFNRSGIAKLSSSSRVAMGQVLLSSAPVPGLQQVRYCQTQLQFQGCNMSGIAKISSSSRVAIGQVFPSSATVPNLQQVRLVFSFYCTRLQPNQDGIEEWHYYPQKPARIYQSLAELKPTKIYTNLQARLVLGATPQPRIPTTQRPTTQSSHNLETHNLEGPVTQRSHNLEFP